MKKGRVVFIFSRLLSTSVSLQKLYFFWRLYPPPKSAERFLKKWSFNPPCALKLWLLYVEHKNKYYDYYYSIELELMLYIRCQRAWDQSFSFQYRRFLCDVKLSLICILPEHDIFERKKCPVSICNKIHNAGLKIGIICIWKGIVTSFASIYPFLH